ncbi:MAG: CRTAC1 family protein, partial [Planctomycetes bacterium]|nr:CRTAC1 family protein [Planctomycetota bacterium]
SANGSGLAALDYDLDGLYDLVFLTGVAFPVDLASEAHRNRLYRNLGGWRFEDVTDRCGLEHIGYSHGVAVGDYDNDGFPDVYVACYGANCLFHNQGDGTFRRVEQQAGVADERWGASSCFLDYNSDGLLDLYVCNYAKWSLETNPYCGDPQRGVRLFCSPSAVEPELDILYRNEGDGTFRDVSGASGIDARLGRAMGVVAAHFNEDEWIDLYVTNDQNANSLFLSDGDGRYRDMSEISGTAYNYLGHVVSSMGVDAADTRRNGLFDLLVTDFQDEFNLLFANGGGGMFQDLSERSGVGPASVQFVSWGIMFADFDLDGWPDAIVTNGHVDDDRQQMGEATALQLLPLFYHNVQGRFTALREPLGPYFHTRHQGRGLTVADLDNDGDQDVAFNHRDEAAAVLRNDRGYPQSGPRRSVVLRFVGTRSNRDAVGTVVTMRAGQFTRTEQIMGGGGYQSARDLRQFFAVRAEETEWHVEIRWPSGQRSTLSGIEPGGAYTVIEPVDARAAPRVVAEVSTP